MNLRPKLDQRSRLPYQLAPRTQTFTQNLTSLGDQSTECEAELETAPIAAHPNLMSLHSLPRFAQAAVSQPSPHQIPGRTAVAAALEPRSSAEDVVAAYRVRKALASAALLYCRALARLAGPHGTPVFCYAEMHNSWAQAATGTCKRHFVCRFLVGTVLLVHSFPYVAKSYAHHLSPHP